MRYDDFDLWIEAQAGDHYPVRAKFKTDVAEGKLNVKDLTQFKQDAQQLKSGFNEEFAKQFGGSLFAKLFPNGIGKLYDQAFKQADQSADTGLRVRLRIAPAEVAELPWEIAYEQPRDCFLATGLDTLLMRYVQLDKAIKGLQVTPPIKILVVVPGRYEEIVKERLSLSQSLVNLANGVEVQVLDHDATQNNIANALVQGDFHILHFVGDGALSNDEPCLLLDDADSEGYCTVAPKEFYYFFKANPSLKLIVLHARSDDENSPVLRCVAEELVKQGVPAAVSLRGRNKDSAATLFAQNFYRRLCASTDRGRVDIAACHGRIRMAAELPRSYQFGASVLVMRTPTGIVFELPGPEIKTVSDLHTAKAIASTQIYNLEQHEKEGDVEAAAQEKQAQALGRTRISRFYKRLVVSAAVKVVVLLFVMALLIFLAAYTRMLNAFRVDDFVGGWLGEIKERPTHSLDESVKVLSVSQSELGSDWSAFRPKHAKLLRAFASAKQKPAVIVFDVEFNDSKPEDEDFANAIRAAQAAGISVVGQKRVDNDGKILPRSEFSSGLALAFGDCWGDVEVGGVLNLPFSNHGAFVNVYEIAHLRRNVIDSANEVEVDPSIALKAVIESFGGAKSGAKAFFNELNHEVIVRAVKGTQSIEKHIPVSRDGPSLEMLINYVPQEKLGENVLKYTDVYNWANSTTPAEVQQLEKNFHDSIVFIGYDTEDDRHTVIGDGSRSGVVVHANAASNILDGDYIHEIPSAVNFLVIIAMVSLGVIVQTVLKKRLPADVPLSDLPGGKYLGDYFGKFKVRLVLLGAVVIYLIIAYLVYSRTHLSFDMSYHLGSLLLGYGLIGILQKKFRSVW